MTTDARVPVFVSATCWSSPAKPFELSCLVVSVLLSCPSSFRTHGLAFCFNNNKNVGAQSASALRLAECESNIAPFPSIRP